MFINYYLKRPFYTNGCAQCVLRIDRCRECIQRARTSFCRHSVASSPAAAYNACILLIYCYCIVFSNFRSRFRTAREKCHQSDLHDNHNREMIKPSQVGTYIIILYIYVNGNFPYEIFVLFSLSAVFTRESRRISSSSPRP